jgi:lipopolysaccharide export LptBFGC system permease protein LptF
VHFEPWGRRELVQFYHRKAQTELDNMVRYRLQPGVFVDNFLGYVIYAEEVSKDKSQLKNIMMAPGASQMGKQDFNLLAPSGKILGSVEQGNLKMIFEDGVVFTHKPGKSEETVLKFDHAQMDLVRIFQDQIFGPDEAKDDYRSYPPDKLWSFIQDIKQKDTDKDRETYHKAHYLFHQRIANSFAVLVFALFALVFSIQDQRGSKGGAWAQVILTIVVSYVLVMGFKWIAENMGVHGAVAAWTPNLLLLGAGIFALNQKNKLPPSEAILDWQNMPWKKRFKHLS